MRATIIVRHKPESARLEEFPEPDVQCESGIVVTIAVGGCGTDLKIVEGKYGCAPRGN